ncbi:TatD family hydrolase [soil metagenome]
MSSFIDTHCHIHFDDYGLDADEVLRDAQEAGVSKMLNVGCTLEDSRSGVNFAKTHDGVWASIGIHPHEAHHYVSDEGALRAFEELAEDTAVTAIGECGLDFYYNHSPKSSQISLLEFQLDLAQKKNLPVIFHVRDAFEDFIPIFDNFSDIKGVVHSFTAEKKVLDKVLSRNLYVGLNGILTFTKDSAQLDMAKAVPLSSVVLETDAPFLTPVPYRGTICQPKHVVETARFLCGIRGESIDELAEKTTQNAEKLFGI